MHATIRVGSIAIVCAALITQVDCAWLYRWQTLIAGMLAIAAAAVGGLFVYRQTAQADAHEVERRRGEFAAARAVMPLTLTMICEYVIECGKQTKGVLDEWDVQREFPRGYSFDVPDPPVGITSDLRLFIRSADKTTGDHAATLIEMIQIMAALSRDLSRDLVRTREPRMLYRRQYVARLAGDFAEIYAVTESLFHFARRRTEKLPKGRPFSAFKLTVILEMFELDPTIHQEAFQAAYDSGDGKEGLWASLHSSSLSE